MLAEPIATNISGYIVKIMHAQLPTRVMNINGSAVTNALLTGLLPKTRYNTTVTTRMNDNQLFEGMTATFETLATGAALYLHSLACTR